MNENSNLEVNKQEFRKIPSLFFLYEVNSNGTIIRNVKSKRHLKIFKKNHNSKTEYWCTQVNIKKKVRKVFLHRVVAECWHGERPEGMQVDHIDRNSLNNDYRNLRYVTKSEQMLNRDYDKFMDKVYPNLAKGNGGVICSVKLVAADGKELYFETSRKAARFLSEKYGKKVKSFSDKFYHRRKHIFDYDVVYLLQRLDAAAPRSKEQSTKYLVGTLDRFNNAKRAEVNDRVKHDL